MKILMTPGPVDLHPRVRRAMSRQVVSHRSREFHNLVKSIVDKAREIFQTENDIFILTGSGTLGVEFGLANILDPDENILVPIYGVFCERMAETIKRYRGRPVTIEIDWRKSIDSAILEENLPRLGEQVVAVSIVHNETSAGTMVKELEKIANIVKDYGKLFIVDAVSSLGGVPLPVDKIGIDICITASQKCLGGPPGLSLISVSKEAWKKIEKKSSKPPLYIDATRFKQSIEKYETPFTPSINLLYGLEEALKIIIEEGLENWQRKHLECSQLLYEEISKIGLSIYPEKEYRSITVISAIPPDDVKPRDIVEKMEENSITIAEGMGKLKDKIIRIACMANISKRRIKYFSRTLRKVIEDLRNASNPNF
ncbi:MAG: alanine--glyoxylate aminotransferase family protein [Nitrososphaerota archaeon]|nr:alanine--glyoxylate aminotransferase family protein [Candidatus Geocrenenecus dongiae]